MAEPKTESNGLKKYLVTVGTTVTTAIVIQSSILFYWGGAMSARMNGAEKNIERCQAQITHLQYK